LHRQCDQQFAPLTSSRHNGFAFVPEGLYLDRWFNAINPSQEGRPVGRRCGFDAKDAEEIFELR